VQLYNQICAFLTQISRQQNSNPNPNAAAGVGRNRGIEALLKFSAKATMMTEDYLTGTTERVWKRANEKMSLETTAGNSRPASTVRT